MPVPAARLIYHPRRERRVFGSTVVYCDSTTGNQDPYVWNDAFLHSYCHITQFHAEIGDVNLWVSGDHFPEFSHLYCDLVFVVARKLPWSQANCLLREDPLVDSAEAWADHYRWCGQHPLKSRLRYTLKADPARSMQAQTADGNLIDIVPLLQDQGLSLPDLRHGMHAGIASQPMTIPAGAAEAIEEMLNRSPVIVRGPELRKLRQGNPGLASSVPAGNVAGNQATEAIRHCPHCGG